MGFQRLVPILSGIVLVIMGLRPVAAVPPFGVYEAASYSPTIVVEESNFDRVRLHLEMEHLPQGATVNFSNRLPGLWENMNTASPGHYLPRFSILIALPNTGNPTVVIESWTDTTMNATPITNLQENSPGQPQVTIGEVGILGGVRVAPVNFKPIAYTSGASTCAVMRSATISIEIDDQTGVNPVTSPRTSFSRPWQQVFEATLTNWEYIPNIGVGAGSHMLIIVSDNLAPVITNYVRWKEQRGMKVTVVLESSIGGNPNANAIRNRIISEVEASSPRIDYVTLIGDETQLAVSMLETDDPTTRFSDVSHPELSPYTNEGHYCAIEGTDVFPDVFLGRWVANLTSEAANIAAKTILHERDTFLADSLRFERSIVAADNEEASQRTTKRYVARELAGHGFSDVDSIWAGPNANVMIQAVNQGETFVNYRGSGWDLGWWGIQFWVPQVGQLNNVRKLPIVTGIGCGVAKFDAADGQCFGEAWMQAGSVNTPKGSAGFIGPCFNTHTVYNDCLDSLLYRAFLDYRISNLQPALVAGKMMTWAIMGDFLDESDLEEIMNTMFRQYLVLSDPSLQLFTDTPVRADLIAPAAVPSGQSQVDVGVSNLAQIGADSLQITAWLGDGNFVTAWQHAGDPHVTLSLNTEGLDTLVFTATGDGAVTAYRIATVGPEGPYVFHCEATLDDVAGGNADGNVNPGESIEWHETLWNIGSENALNVVATLSSSSSSVTITTPSIAVGDVDMGESFTTDGAFVFSVSDDALAYEALEFTVTFTMDNGGPQSWPVVLTNHAPSAVIESAVVADDNNNFWDRGEAVGFEILVANDGNDDLTPATCTLTSTDTFVTILDGETELPALDAGTSYAIPAGAFAAVSSWTTPAGHAVTLELTVTAEMGTYTFTRIVPIQL